MRALIISTNYGVEQDELVAPADALRDAGAEITIAATERGEIATLVGDKEPGRAVTADAALGDLSADDFDLLVVPGGTINADTLRTDPDALALVKAFAASGKTVASICHGPWLLAEADLLRGKTLTSYASIATDLRNAGGQWTDRELVADEAEGWTLITSRSPDDLDAFNGAIVAVQG